MKIDHLDIAQTEIGTTPTVFNHLTRKIEAAIAAPSGTEPRGCIHKLTIRGEPANSDHRAFNRRCSVRKFTKTALKHADIRQTQTPASLVEEDTTLSPRLDKRHVPAGFADGENQRGEAAAGADIEDLLCKLSAEDFSHLNPQSERVEHVAGDDILCAALRDEVYAVIPCEDQLSEAEELGSCRREHGGWRCDTKFGGDPLEVVGEALSRVFHVKHASRLQNASDESR